MDLASIKKVYFIGIKGSGMIAIVEIFKSRGVEIIGSDTKEKFFTDEILDKLGIKYFEGFQAENIPQNVDLVIYSTVYNGTNNVEFQEAKDIEIPMMSYPEILGELFNEKIGIAVSGTHGKTTTTALLAYAMKNADADPTAIVGSRVIEWKSSSLAGKGKYFVAEADEYQNKLRYYNPYAVVLTSVDWDHPDYFPTFLEYKKVFEDFVARIPRHGFLTVWGDSADTSEVAKSAKCEIIKYGFGGENDLKISNAKCQISNQIQNPNDRILKPTQSFEIIYGDKNLGKFEIQLVGKHNILNAVAVIAVCQKLKLDIEKVREALKNFKGTTRRFEYVGERNGAILIDDYAHHPEEIQATLKAAREIYPEKNIITIFHPHTFTRTKALLPEFSQSFNDTNEVIVIDIYGSAREAQGGVSSKDLVDLINKYDHDKAEYIPTINEVADHLKDKISENDVVISMGAGDVWKVVKALKV